VDLLDLLADDALAYQNAHGSHGTSRRPGTSTLHFH
jgi:hypothetical protein